MGPFRQEARRKVDVNHAVGFFIDADRANADRPVNRIYLRYLLLNCRVVEIIHVKSHLYLPGSNTFLDSRCCSPCNDMNFSDIGIRESGF